MDEEQGESSTIDYIWKLCPECDEEYLVLEDQKHCFFCSSDLQEIE